jgi:biotin synthase-related radical SAM superfamily protein
MTAGCRGKTTEVACNRPFGDSSPTNLRSFPFQPNKSARHTPSETFTNDVENKPGLLLSTTQVYSFDYFDA